MIPVENTGRPLRQKHDDMGVSKNRGKKTQNGW